MMTVALIDAMYYGQAILHPLNRRYEDLPKAKPQRIWGRVVRLRKNL
jgi:hypothetical protein